MKKLFFLTLFLALVGFLKVMPTLTNAQTYNSVCGGCTGPGSWCVENGNGYQCGSQAQCQGSRVATTFFCPPGCTCGAYHYTGGATTCGNNCIAVESCVSAPPPSPIPPGQPPPPIPPGGGGCTVPGEICIPGIPANWSQIPPSNCGQSGRTGSLQPCGGGWCCNNFNPPPQPPPLNPPVCAMSLSLSPASPIQAGASTVLTANTSGLSASSFNIVFNSVNPVVASVIKTSARTANVFGEGGGSTTLRATMTATRDGLNCSLVRTIPITVNAPSWWQVRDGDVISGGDLISKIPTSCTGASCNPAFDLKGTGGFPGIPIYGRLVNNVVTGDYDFAASAVNGVKGIPSETKFWVAKSPFNNTTANVDYESFIRQIPADVRINDIPNNITGAILRSAAAGARGFTWYRVPNGDATIAENITLVGDEKIILLVQSGDLRLRGNVQIQNPGRGFFMALVNKDTNGNKGDIIVTSSVQTGPVPPPPPPPGNVENPNLNRNCGQTCGNSAQLCPSAPFSNCLCDGDGDPGTNAPSTCRYMSSSQCTGVTRCAPTTVPTGWAFPRCTSVDTGNSYMDTNASVPGGQFPSQAVLDAACAAAIVQPTPTPTPGPGGGSASNLTGMFFAEGEFVTGTTGAANDSQFVFRGAIAALDGIRLLRDQGGVRNGTSPSEIFEFGPELISNFPREFNRDKIIWQEVAP